MQTFLSSKMPQNSLEEKFFSLEFYTESKYCAMADQLLSRTALGFTAFLCFLTNMQCCKNSMSAKTDIWNSCEYQFNVKIWKL